MGDSSTETWGGTPGLHLRLMGVPEVRLNGVPVTFSRRRALALLVYLAVTGHIHTRDVLATLLSGEASESQARKRLSNALGEVRQRVGDYIVTSRDTATFNTSLPSWIDVRAFRTELAGGMQDDGLEQLDSALALFNEEFLSGLVVSEAPGFEEWVLLQGEALRTQAVQALQQLVDRAVRTRAHTEGIVAARRLVTLEPWLEEAHRNLMILLSRVGQRQEALAQYELCRSILLDDLGEEPAAETVALYNRLKAPHAAVSSSLPSPATPIVGRETELQVLTGSLTEPESRLITLVGLAGSGKTRLALECAHVLSGVSSSPEQPYPDGVFFIPLTQSASAPEQDDGSAGMHAERVAGAIAAVILGGALDPGDSLGQLRTAVSSKAMLLILDGADAVPESALAPVVQLLVECPEVRLLATSRRPLQAPNERVLLLVGLALPSAPDEVDVAPAGRLLLMEAQRAQLGFALRDEDRPHVVELCRLVEGLPLALTLLAPWLPRLNPAEMVQELEGSLDLLSSVDPRVPIEHRSVREILARSWAALPPDERRTLRGISVFHAGVDSATAREVVGCSIQDISRLMDRGFVVADEHGRYRAHELVRRWAAQELRAHPPEESVVRARHADHYASLIAGASGEEQTAEGLQLGDELENVRDAWRWSIDQRAWDRLDRMLPGLATSVPDSLDLLRDAAAALRSTYQSTDRSDTGLLVLLGQVLMQQGTIELQASHHDAVERTLREAMEIGRATGSPPLMEIGRIRRAALLALGDAHFDAGELTEAAGAYARALALDRDLDSRWWTIESTTNLARVALAKNDRVRASALIAPILGDLMAGTFPVTGDPSRAYLTAYEVLHCIADSRERALLDTGRRLVRERADGAPADARRLLSLPHVSSSRPHAANGHGNGHSNGNGNGLQPVPALTTNGHSKT